MILSGNASADTDDSADEIRRRRSIHGSVSVTGGGKRRCSAGKTLSEVRRNFERLNQNCFVLNFIISSIQWRSHKLGLRVQFDIFCLKNCSNKQKAKIQLYLVYDSFGLGVNAPLNPPDFATECIIYSRKK